MPTESPASVVRRQTIAYVTRKTGGGSATRTKLSSSSVSNGHGGGIDSSLRSTLESSERTDYTYGDSGSYRVDRLGQSFKTPDMSRLPIHLTSTRSSVITTASKQNLVLNGAYDSDSQQSSVGSNMPRQSSSASINGQLQSTHKRRTSKSRSSVTSSSSSQYAESTVGLEYNNNSLTSISASQPPGSHTSSLNSTTIPTMSRSTDNRRSANIRRSSRILSTLNTSASQLNANNSLQDYGGDRSTASSSSTYVYNRPTSYKDSVDSSTVGRGSWSSAMASSLGWPSWFRAGSDDNNKRRDQGDHQHQQNNAATSYQYCDDDDRYLHNLASQGDQPTEATGESNSNWLTKHIFGLAKPSQYVGRSRSKPTTNIQSGGYYGHQQQFMSSDVEEEDNLDQRQPRRQIRQLSSTKATVQRSWWQQMTDPITLLGSLLYTLASLLLFACYRSGQLVVGGVTNASRSLVKIVGELKRRSMFGRSRSSKRATRSFASSSNATDDDDDGSGCGWCLVPLILALFLIPLLLLAAFLLAPSYADDKDQSATSLFRPISSDFECSQLTESTRPYKPVNSSWQIAKWRLACLYVNYLEKEAFSTPSYAHPLVLASWLANSLTSWLPSWPSFKSSSDHQTPVINLNVQDIDALKVQLSSFSTQLSSQVQDLADQLHRHDLRLDEVDSRTMQSSSQLTGKMDQLTNEVVRIDKRQADAKAIDSHLEAFKKELVDRLLQVESHLSELDSGLGDQKEANRIEIDQLSVSLKQLERQLKQLTMVDKTEEALTKLLSEAPIDSPLIQLIRRITEQLSRRAIDEHFASSTLSTGQLKTNCASIHECVLNLITHSLDKFAADRTGRADFALESAGGSIVGTRCTRTYTEGASVLSVFGLPLARFSNSPRTILTPGNNPGDCWPFHGNHGQVIVKLSTPILIEAVTLEHLPRQLAPNAKLDSAPKEFLIKALSSESDDNGVVLGQFTYDIEGPSLQTFPITNINSTFQYVEMEILSNHGHPTYTCVYRLRVHGNMTSPDGDNKEDEEQSP